MAAPSPPWRLMIGLAVAGLLVVLFLLGVVGMRLPFTTGPRSVHQAISQGNVARMKELLDREPAGLEQRNGIGMTPLHAAAYHGRVRALEELIRRGADVKARWKTVSTNDGDWTALHVVAMRGNADAGTVLVRAGADANALTRQGQTPLDIAAFYRQEAVAVVLSDAGGIRAAELR